MKSILVTGGSGFIGSHTCIDLIVNGFKLYVVDSNINSSPFVMLRIKKILDKSNISFDDVLSFNKGDIRDEKFIKMVFQRAIQDGNPIEAVIHFAGLKSVSESVRDPMLYWENNVLGSFNLFNVMRQFNCFIIVFSSSATVYGNIKSGIINEDFNLLPENPYGQTKVAIECMLEALFNSEKDMWRIANLRYFNPIGAHYSALIGESSIDVPSNLFPHICGVAQAKYKKLRIFGNNWPTNDGTCIRDYIHVMDLAEAHTKTLLFLIRNKPQYINLNIGTGIGTSVLELVEKFKKVNKCDVPYEFYERRLGDVPILVANNEKAISKLDWFPKRNLEDMCKDGWRWQHQNPNGYN